MTIPSVEERRVRSCMECVFSEEFCDHLAGLGPTDIDGCRCNFTVNELRELIDHYNYWEQNLKQGVAASSPAKIPDGWFSINSDSRQEE